MLGRYVRMRVDREDHRAAVRELPGLLRFGLVLLPSQLASGLRWQSGTWVVGSVARTATAGAYSRALGLSSKLSEAGYRISEILLPGLVERRADDGDAAAELLARTVRVCALPLTVLVAAGAGAASGVLKVFGPGFDRANVPLALLLGAYTLSVLTSILSQGFLADGAPGPVTRRSLGCSLLVLVLVVPLGQQYGAGGVATALLAGPVVEFVLFDRALARHFGVARSSLVGGRAILGSLVAVAAGSAAAWGVLRLGTSIPWTVLSLAAGAASAAVVLLALGLVDAEERRAIARLAGRLRR
jgi:O-antigen/teichoic acid export membrane protein